MGKDDEMKMENLGKCNERQKKEVENKLCNEGRKFG